MKGRGGRNEVKCGPTSSKYRQNSCPLFKFAVSFYVVVPHVRLVLHGGVHNECNTNINRIV